jgi:hypothetical protein
VTSPLLIAQQPVDGTNSGAPVSGSGTPSHAAPVTSRVGAATTTVLTAIDSKTISSVSNTNWNDNRFRAYWNSPSQGFVDGLVKFDLSSIPNTATITSLTLRAYHEEGFGNPRDNPEVRAYRVTDDGWSRGATDSHPGVAEVLTPIMTGFPTADLVPVDFVLDVSAANWSGDLLDDKLSLLLRNEAGSVGRYSYVYFYGSDGSPAPPELIVEYDLLSLIVSNAVAGSAAVIEVVGAAPNSTCLVGWSRSSGSTSLNTPWGNFTIDLKFPIRRLNPFTADAGGYGVTTLGIPAGAAGHTVYMQGLVVDPSNQAELTNSLKVTVL